MIERDDQLRIGGVSTTALVDEFDTPLYVYDQETIRERYNEVVDTFRQYYDDFDLHYAVKANSNPAILQTLHDEGAGFDCGSPAEIRLVRKIGADQEEILYTGLYNRRDELDYALEQGVPINLDSDVLLDKMDRLPETLSFRVNPGIGRDNFGLIFAGEGVKFGVPEEEIVDAYRKAADRGVERFGMHMMTGSCVLDPDYFQTVTEKLLEIAGRVSDELDIEFEFIDIGGGLGIPYRQDEDRLDIDETAHKVTETFKQGIEEHGLGRPELRMEPGRYLVAEAGVLLTQVTAVKETDRTFVGIDTGMHHMIRPMLLDAYHEIVLASDLEREPDGPKTVVGPVCSSTDTMAEDRDLPPVEDGDVLAIMDAGAYGYVMASNWNTRRLPAEIMVTEDGPELVRGRQSFKQMFQNTPFFHQGDR
jgi:diaminopimelate decarboxylase